VSSGRVAVAGVETPPPTFPPPTWNFTSAWPQRLADPGHSSHTTDSTTTTSNVSAYTERWRLQMPRCSGASYVGGGLVASPIPFNGVIYVGANNGCLLAVNEANGTIKWSRFFAWQPKLTCGNELGITSSVTVADNGAGSAVVTFHSPDGYLYQLNGDTGATLSRSLVQIPSQTNPPGNDVFAWSSPTSANGQDYVGVSSNCDTPFVQGKVVAYDHRTGNVAWTHKTITDGFTGAGVWTDPAVDNAGNVWAATGSTDDPTDAAHPNTNPGFEQYSLIKLNPADGNLLCKAPAPPAPTGDPDFASSPILFTGTVGGVANTPLVGATNKDGWFRAYKQSDCTTVWQAQVGTSTADGQLAALAGGVWDGTHLFVMSNATSTGGQWIQSAPGVWSESNGTPANGSIRELNPSTGDLVTVSGHPFEIALPSNPLGPCTLNGSQLLFCSGGNFEHIDVHAHDAGVFVVDINAAAPGVLIHLEDIANFPAFGQLAVEGGHIIQANSDALVLWG
jgi:outer membrane protein assembly factor BamB